MTGKAEWGKRAVQDDVDTKGWGGRNVFDVLQSELGIALNGTKYQDW
jgi:hypothetical protein